MEDLLEKAFKEASKLSSKEQKTFAAFIIDELKKEEKWQHSLNSSAKKLRSLAKEALSEYEAGNTDPLDADKL